MSQTGYYLTPETYDELERVIGLQEPGFKGGTARGGGSRQVAFVTVTAGGGNPYTGTVKHADATGAHLSYDSDVRLREFNGAKLYTGHTYAAIRTGYDNAGHAVYLTLASCQLAEQLAGDGLYPDEQCESEPGSGDSGSGDGCCPKLRVLDGCHIVVTETGVHVDVDSLVGENLEVEAADCSDPDADCCPKIQVSGKCVRVLTDVDIEATCNGDGTITITLNKVFEWVKTLLSDDDCQPSSDSGSSTSPPDYYCVSPAGTGDPSSCVAFASGETPDPLTWDVTAGPFTDDATCGGGCV